MKLELLCSIVSTVSIVSAVSVWPQMTVKLNGRAILPGTGGIVRCDYTHQSEIPLSSGIYAFQRLLQPHVIGVNIEFDMETECQPNIVFKPLGQDNQFIGTYAHHIYFRIYRTKATINLTPETLGGIIMIDLPNHCSRHVLYQTRFSIFSRDRCTVGNALPTLTDYFDTSRTTSELQAITGLLQLSQQT